MFAFFIAKYKVGSQGRPFLVNEKEKLWNKVSNRKAGVTMQGCGRFCLWTTRMRLSDHRDIRNITAAIKQDSIPLIRLSGALRTLVSGPQVCNSDPYIQATVENGKLHQINCAEEATFAGKALETASTAKAEDRSTFSIVIETALNGVVAACSAISVQPSELEQDSPDRRSPRIIVMEATSYIKVSRLFFLVNFFFQIFALSHKIHTASQTLCQTMNIIDPRSRAD